jgi:elongation factor Ts
MMECKKALDKAGGDADKAFDELRKGGLKAQEKLSGRAANEGRIGSYISEHGKVGVLVALRCETESVAKNDEFLSFLAELVAVIAKEKPADAAAIQKLTLSSGGTVAESLTELVNKIRENITVGQFARCEGDAVSQYVHFDQKKGAMVSLTGGPLSNPKVAEVGKELGMQIVFSPPDSLSRETLDPQLIEKEREILLAQLKNDPKNEKKPEEILKKIIEGKVNAFAAGLCLVEQPYIREPKQSVEKYVASSGAGVTITDFAYIATDVD